MWWVIIERKENDQQLDQSGIKRPRMVTVAIRMNERNKEKNDMSHM
jgi:hypothetical protein